jgi:F-type H+-transporting ATPase subunit b
MMVLRYFALNTNLFETNVLNLLVVLGIVVTFVGDALLTLLDQRQKIILLALREIDQKAKEVQQRLEAAREAVEMARVRALEIRAQAIQTMEQENARIKQTINDDMRRLREIRVQRIQLERQRMVESIANKIARITLKAVEGNLLIIFNPQNHEASKHKELNDMHVRTTLRQSK